MAKIPLRKLGEDARLILRLMMRGKLRWVFFDGSDGRGELCIGGIRYTTDLECGVPVLDGFLRSILANADAAPLGIKSRPI